MKMGAFIKKIKAPIGDENGGLALSRRSELLLRK